MSVPMIAAVWLPFLADWTPFLVLGGFFAVIGAVIVAGAFAEGKRRQAMEAKAQELGFEYHRDGDSSMIGEIRRRSQICQKGRSRRFKNTMQGQIEDVGVVVSDFRYVTGGCKNSNTHHLTIVGLNLPQADLPTFQLRPEHFLDNIAGWMGVEDIDFDDSLEFSNKYHLKGDDEAAVRNLFTREARQHFEAQGQNWCVEGQGPWLILYRANKRLKPEEVDEAIRQAWDVLFALNIRA